MRSRPTEWLWRLWPAVLLVAAFAAAAPAADIEVPPNEELEDAIPEGENFTGRDIYQRYLKNKLHSAVQHQKIISTDPGGSTQTTRFWVRWKDYRDENDEPTEGVVAKTLVRFQDPFDMRHTGYLVIVNDDLTRDQFVYQPSARRVRRINLQQASIAGTDYNFDDLGFEDIDDATYTRFPDEELGGVAVYVVEAVAKPRIRSRYGKTLAYLEKEHYVPLRARYWDHAGVEIKEMNAVPSSLKEFDGVWVATDSTMKNLMQGTSSTMLVEKLDPNTELADRLFSQLELMKTR